MLFNSLEFLIFFPIATILYFGSRGSARLWVLVFASCLFYAAAMPKYLIVLIAIAVIDYAAGIWIEKLGGRRRFAALVASLASNLGILFYFKYMGFFAETISLLSRNLGWEMNPIVANVVLPIGLSFHTFQAMSYTIEVYRGKQRAERSFLVYVVYVLFYPQLVAGPIERPQNLLPQLKIDHRWSTQRAKSGALLMLSGFFKKVVIADRMAIFINDVYATPAAYGASALWAAAILFYWQIYCDFSGYTDIARGSARIMGIELMENFDKPFLAPSFRHLWQKWHISLNTWFRDYVYVPLGGNRTGKLRLCFNLMIVAMLSGLWHGANWTFVVWGLLGGSILIVESAVGLKVETDRSRPRFWVHVAVTLFLGILLAIFFRSHSIENALLTFRRIFGFENGYSDLQTLSHLADANFVVCCALAVALFAIQIWEGKYSFWTRVSMLPRYVRWTVYYVLAFTMISLLLTHPQQKPQTFIYFQF